MTPVDPFDLPDWLGIAEVTWTAQAGLRTGPLVAGMLEAADVEAVPCDLLAVDEAYPAPVVDDEVRLGAHQAWRHGEVHLVDRAGRLTITVPGTAFTADLVLDALDRLARAVGASAERYAVRLRLTDGRGPAR
ncbi:hypothetical protein GON03_22215 [Nocardioides sp. MAH-18]|uniref:Uncharacterized protein n=1 Tax=Nocardioides agri TaxID=2682843 RepID=A0A6L6Y2U2_9ACTN|nr:MULTISPECIES: hypothetical protein [unclassified Nocardioides]MBA2952743.1 hypothetical protein [Nocardioides sp. CGMCC 1.13656]MVQ51905.1 hypothetical protein [Nocardioides sp. MAH-18]